MVKIFKIKKKYKYKINFFLDAVFFLKLFVC